MTLLVTGCCGFIGSNFVYYYLDEHKDARIIGLDKLTYAGNLDNLSNLTNEQKSRFVFVKGDINNAELVEYLLDVYDIDVIVNFAAESHVDRSIYNPRAFVETNVLGVQTLLDVAKKKWYINGKWKHGKKFVQISTDEVYGTLGPTGKFTEKTPLSPRSPYSASKASADLLVIAHHETYGMPVNITRCSNNYGPYQFPEKLIPLMINNCLNKRPLPVYGDGMNIRDWLYVEDHCKAIDMVLHKGKIGEIYNIGGHNERTNIHIVKTIISYIHDNVDSSVDESLIKYVADRKGHDRRYGIDPTKIREELGWYPETSFEDGIIKTIKWYLENKEWMKNVTSGEYQKYYERMYSNR